MKIVGIIAEYDPFHRGHERHLRLAREAAGADAVFVALSPCFRQRGELALLSPGDRARCALAAGADAVFALPAAHVLRDAEHYARAGVGLLHALGCTHLAFGAEEPRLSLLCRTAEQLENPDPLVTRRLRELLREGTGFPKARAEALSVVYSEMTRVMSEPNNILAVCYLRALSRLPHPMVPVLIPRNGAYHADRIDPDAPSASALRAALSRGAWEQALPALTEESRRVVRAAFLAGTVPDPRILDALLLARLRSMTQEEARRLPDVSEGLERRLLHEARSARSREELISRVSSRRYPAARISRLCACALLGITAPSAPDPDSPPEALLLGLRPRPELTARWKQGPLTVLSSLRESRFPELWAADLAAWRIFAQCTSRPGTFPFTERMAVADSPSGV